MMSKQNVPELRFPEFSGEWEEKSVGDHFEFKNGLNKGKEYFGSGTPIVNFKDVFNNRAIYSSTLGGRVTVTEKEKELYSVHKGDLFFTRTSEIIEEIGMPSVVMEEIPEAVFSGFVLRARKVDDSIDDYFKKYVFSTNYFRKEMIKKSSMTTRALTSGTAIKTMKFNLPLEKKEQRKIGDFFTKLDRLIELEEKKLELLEEQKKGYMQKIFSQELRFKDEDGNDYPDWEERQLKEKSTYESSKISLSQVMEYEDGPYPVYDANKVIKYIETYDQKRAYISIIKDGAGVGRIVLCPSKSSIIGTMGYIKPVTIEPYYLYLQLQTINYSKYMVGSTIPHIYYKDYSKEKIKISSIREQKKISEFFKYLNNRVELIDRKISQLKIRKKALLQKMFV